MSEPYMPAASLNASLPLPAPVLVRGIDGEVIVGDTVAYRATYWNDGQLILNVAVFDADHNNTSLTGLTDLPHGVPDAPQWFLDAVDSMLIGAMDRRKVMPVTRARRAARKGRWCR